jgi:transposase
MVQPVEKLILGGMERQYPSDVSDAEWALLEPIFINKSASPRRGRRESADSARRSFNAIRHVLKSGRQWRMLPNEHPPRTTAHDALTRWTKSGLWERLSSALRERRRCSLKKTPHARRGHHRQPEREVCRHRCPAEQRL